MRSALLVFSLLISASIVQTRAQSANDLFSKSAKQRHASTKPGSLRDLTGKNGMYPDSIQTYRFDRFEQEYDEFPLSTQVFTYDQNGNPIEVITIRKPWSSYKDTYVYSNGKVIEEIHHNWNEVTKTWFPTERTQVFSDVFGEDTAEVYASYDTVNQIWIEYGRYITAIDYDNQNRPVLTTYGYYDTPIQEWEMELKIQYMYSGTDTLPSEAIISGWDSGAWKDNSWTKQMEWGLGFSTNIDHIWPTLVWVYDWDGLNWVPAYYDSTSFENGKMLDYSSYRYNPDSMYFIRHYSEHYSYDVKGNEIRYLQLEWEYGVADTNRLDFYDFTYGSSGEIVELVSRSLGISGGIEINTKDVYYYGATSLVSVEKPDGVIYPNPVGSGQKLFIQSEASIEQVQLYSGNGAMIRMWGAPDGDGLDIQGIAPGLYFIYLLDVAGNSSTQMLQIR